MTEDTTFLRLSKLPDIRPEIAIAAVLICTQNISGSDKAFLRSPLLSEN